MTSQAARRRPAVELAGAELTGTGILTRLALRRDRIMIVAWVYVLAAFAYVSVVSTKKLYPTAASLLAFAKGAGADRVTRAIYGPAGDLHTLGGLATWKLSVFGVVGVAVMSMFIVVRHTRGDEDAGRLELVGAGAVGRLAALTSGLLTALLANLGVALLVAIGLAVGACPGSPRWRSGSGWPPPAASSRRSRPWRPSSPGAGARPSAL